MIEQIILSLQKQTKNKLVYGKEGSAIPSVYIEKSAFPTSPPKIKVTLEVCNEE